MRALTLSGAKTLTLDEVDPPGDPGPGEVLIAPVVGGICGTDLHLWRRGPIGGASQILGHELAAEVVAVGPSVAGLAAGDRVTVVPIVACGVCELCSRGRGELCPGHDSLGISHRWGGLADLALVRADQLVPIPDDLSWEQGALIEPLCVATTGVQRAGLEPGGRLLIVGGGPIGALAALHAEAAGAGQILVSEPSARRAGLIERLGFEVVDPGAIDVAELCRERGGGLGFDCAVDCAGTAAAFRTAFDAVGPAGTVAVTALHGAPVQLDLAAALTRGVTIAAAIAYPLTGWGRRVEQVAAGELRVERVVTSKVALGDGPGTIARLAAGADDLKVLVEVSA